MPFQHNLIEFWIFFIFFYWDIHVPMLLLDDLAVVVNRLWVSYLFIFRHYMFVFNYLYNMKVNIYIKAEAVYILWENAGNGGAIKQLHSFSRSNPGYVRIPISAISQTNYSFDGKYYELITSYLWEKCLYQSFLSLVLCIPFPLCFSM